MVRFGLLHLFETPGERTERQYYDENIELIEYADQVGLDSVWLAEHHFSEYGVMPSTQVFGAYIAARTKRIRIGTAVVVLPFHNPVRVAEEFAFLDQLSGGRLDFGVGRGYQPGEFEGYGVPMAESRTRYDEAVEIIRQAWTEDQVSFEGKHYTFKGIKPRPQPLQKPSPPLFAASFNPDTIKYQAMRGMNLLFSPLTTPPDRIDEYRQILRSGGKDPANFRIGGLAFVYVHEDREQALREFELPCMWYMRTFCKLIPAKKYGPDDDYYKQMSQALHANLSAYDQGQMPFAFMTDEGPFAHAYLVGDPQTVKDKLRRLVKTYGLTEVLCWTRLGGLAHDKCMHSMELFVKKVIEPLRAEGSL